MNTKKPTFPDSLLTRYISGEATDDECRKVEAWISESSENRRYFQELEDTWIAAEASAPNEKFDTDAAWKNVLQTIDAAEKKPEAEGRPKVGQVKKIQPWWWGAAASVLLIAAFIFWLQSSSEAEFTVFEAGQAKREVSLPDGSRMTLKAGSSAQIPENFAQKRSLRLSGGAFFEVKTNAVKPFEVSTEKTYVKVLGTKFFLEDSRERTSCYVTEGKVEFRKVPGQEKLLLRKGESAVLQNDEFRKQKTPSADVLFWLDKRLEFRSQPLSEVLAKLEKLYGITADFTKPEAADCSVTASFKGESAEEILRILSISAGLELHKKSPRAYELRGACK